MWFHVVVREPLPEKLDLGMVEALPNQVQKVEVTALGKPGKRGRNEVRNSVIEGFGGIFYIKMGPA